MMFKCQIKSTFGNSPKLEKAKQFPLTEIYKGQLKKTGKVLMGVCPFHQEDTPSFVIYPDTNSFHCFGCGKSGDGLTLYQKINDCNFKDALEALS